jgi:hypothetical protein
MNASISLSAQDSCFEVVVQDCAWDAAKVVKGMQMTTQKPTGIRRDGELQVHGPRPTERHDKGVQTPLPTVMIDRAKVTPVDLGLLARLGFET